MRLPPPSASSAAPSRPSPAGAGEGAHRRCQIRSGSLPPFPRGKGRGWGLRSAQLAVALVLAASAGRAEDLVDPRSLEAERLAAEARDRYAAGAYSAAAELYARANEQSPAVALLYDLALVHDRHLRAPAVALAYYRRCLAAPDLDDALAARVRARVAELERAAPASAQRTDTAPADAVVRSPMRPWSFVLGGAGLAALGVGAFFGLRARAFDADAGAYCSADRCTDARALSLTHDAVSAARIADVAFVGGAVLLAGGIVLYLLTPPTRRAVNASAAGITLGGASP